MNVEEFKEKYIDEDGEVNCKCVDMEESVNGKYITYTRIYSVEGQFFSVDTVESNVGYWGDSDTISQDVYEVEPYERTIKGWEVIS